MLFPSFFNASAGGYEIEQSLRFNSGDNAYLSRTFGTGGSSVNFTISLWAKKASNDDAGFMLLSTSGTAGSGRDQFYINSAEKFQFYGSSQNNEDSNNVLLRDPSAWYHIVVACDMDNGTATDRIKVFYNGQRQASVSTSITSFSFFGGNRVHYIGTENDGVYNNGYIAEYHYVDGTTKDETDFGEYDNNGVWRPKRYTGSHGSNGFYLKFDPSATNGIGHDHSGNGNNWTPTGFDTINSTASTYDVMSDTPTTNWCTLNPLSLRASYNNDCNDGNLGIEAVGGNWDRGTKGTIGASSGKWYWEYTHGTISGSFPPADIGVTKYASEINHYLTGGGSGSADTYLIQGNNGNKYNAGSGSSYGSAFTTGDKCNIALDLDNGKVWFGKNGTWFNSGDPAAGTNEAFSGLSGTFWPLFYWGISAGTGGINQAYFNFGQRAFAYTPPTGFKALNTSNLPAPTVKDGSDYFDTKLYTGTDASLTVNYSFSPDFVWIKSRSHASDHSLYDIVRGTNLQLRSNSTIAEINDTNGFNSFDTDGFTLGVDGGDNINAASRTYAAWAWDAGGTGSSNTDGSITSTVSANPSAGFSIVTYSGTGNGETVGHGLGVAPAFIITKSRNNSFDWGVLHHKAGTPGYSALLLNLSASLQTNIAYWNNTAPTSTTFSIGSTGSTGGANNNYVAYCFAEVEGYSKFGSYVGNNSSDGPAVFLGFKPAWILIKRSDAINDWLMTDSSRLGYNTRNELLWANLAAAEYQIVHLDILSNGFKVRTTNPGWNASGGTYIFMAFASSPFGGSGVSPATAR